MAAISFSISSAVAPAIAAANGSAPGAAFMKSWEETFFQPDSQYSTSMLRDIERGGQTEVEHILGFMLDKAIKAQIVCNTPLLAYTSVKAFEQRRAAGRLP
jgi:2-dehydropantoate 2-reductase